MEFTAQKSVLDQPTVMLSAVVDSSLIEVAKGSSGESRLYTFLMISMNATWLNLWSLQNKVSWLLLKVLSYASCPHYNITNSRSLIIRFQLTLIPNLTKLPAASTQQKALRQIFLHFHFFLPPKVASKLNVFGEEFCLRSSDKADAIKRRLSPLSGHYDTHPAAYNFSMFYNLQLCWT